MTISTIVFLTSSHSAFDDRIFYQQAISLCKLYNVIIVSSTENLNETKDNITILGSSEFNQDKKKKINFFIESLITYDPQLIICSEPIAIYAANKYKKSNHKKVKIIFDVTEWYPSKSNLESFPFFKKNVLFFKLLLFNIFTSSMCDGFIFGEFYKSLPHKFIFPFKKSEIISYYPDLNYIQYAESEFTANKICLGFTGTISTEKGINNFFNVAKLLKHKKPNISIKLKIIGWVLNISEQNKFETLCFEARKNNIEVQLLNKQSFEEFSEKLQDVDILFDLRELDIENSYCLPIKIFYYAACGKPVIYSNLKAISREIKVSDFGYLVNPTDYDIISDYVVDYLDNPHLYYNHSIAARKLAETVYNWQSIKPLFLQFINKI